MTAVVRPASSADVDAYYASVDVDKELTPAAHPHAAVCAVRDGKVLGLGGIMWDADGKAWAFLACPKDLMPRPLAAHRLARRVIDAAFEAGETVVHACPTPGVATAKRWLAALGFAFDRVDGDYEVWIARWTP